MLRIIDLGNSENFKLFHENENNGQILRSEKLSQKMPSLARLYAHIIFQMGKQDKVHIRLHFITLNGVQIKDSEKIRLWVGYGQADKGKDAKANKKKRNGLGMHFKFAIRPERSPDLYLCAYGHGSLKPKHKFGECVIDFGKLPWNTPKEMELQLSCRNEEEHASVLVTVEKRRAGYKPYHAKKEKRTELQRIVNNSGLFVDYVPPTVMAQ